MVLSLYFSARLPAREDRLRGTRQTSTLHSAGQATGRSRYTVTNPLTLTVCFDLVSVSVSTQDGIVALGKAHRRSAPSLSSLPKVALEITPIFVWLIEHRSFPTPRVEYRPLPFSTPLQAISTAILWPVHVQNIPQASEHLCPAELQTRCDICCARQSVCLFIPTDPGMPRAVDPQKSL